jgi:hypothetical protein
MAGLVALTGLGLGAVATAAQATTPGVDGIRCST